MYIFVHYTSHKCQLIKKINKKKHPSDPQQPQVWADRYGISIQKTAAADSSYWKRDWAAVALCPTPRGPAPEFFWRWSGPIRSENDCVVWCLCAGSGLRSACGHAGRESGRSQYGCRLQHQCGGGGGGGGSEELRGSACVLLGTGGIKPLLLPGLTSSSQRVLFSGQKESGEAVGAAGH